MAEIARNSAPGLFLYPFYHFTLYLEGDYVVTVSFSPRCKVHTLLVEYVERNFTPHHYPLHADHLPNMSQCLQLLEDIYTCLRSGRKTAIQ